MRGTVFCAAASRARCWERALRAECVPDWKVLHRPPLGPSAANANAPALCPWLLLAWSHSRDPRDPSILCLWLTEGNIREPPAPHRFVYFYLFYLQRHLGKARGGGAEKPLSEYQVGMRARLFCGEIYLGGKCTFINTPPQRVSTKPYGNSSQRTHIRYTLYDLGFEPVTSEHTPPVILFMLPILCTKNWCLSWTSELLDFLPIDLAIYLKLKPKTKARTLV